MFSATLIVAALCTSVNALRNGVGKLPKMGYDTFNAFECSYDQSEVAAQVDAMVKNGLVASGYNSVILDDCYTLKNRSFNGTLIAGEYMSLLEYIFGLKSIQRGIQWPRLSWILGGILPMEADIFEDPAKFPFGMKNFTSTIKAKGVSASAYGDNGYETCAGYPGSYGYEVQDLMKWTEWGFDYLKYDNCYIPFDNITQENEYGRYIRMSDAIAEVSASTGNPPFQFSLCEWGWQQPWIWGMRISHSWRINGDIKPYWPSIASIIDQASFNYWATDFYGHNDMDIMEVGNTGQGSPVGNLTYGEAKSHFTAWALLKSPLIIGTDLTNATAETIEILNNIDLIKINQDPNVGESISPFRWGINPDYTSNSSFPAQYWSGNSSYGIVFMVLNTLDTTEDMFFSLTESWAIRSGRQYSVYDMWSHTTNSTVVRNMTVTLPPHGVVALLLNDNGPEPSGLFPHCGFFYQCSFPNGTYSTN